MITLFRVDDRLVHGQVATKWVGRTQTNKIYIVDDQVAGDELMNSVCRGLAPQGTSVDCITVEKACTLLNKAADHPAYRAMVIVKTPQAALSMKEAGVRVDRLVVGGMQMRAGRTKFYRNISADGDERACMKRLGELGVEVVCQAVPDDAAIPVEELLRE